MTSSFPFFFPGGHPSDNLGAILAVADHLARQGERVTVKDVLEGMIKAHEIQGGLALLNSFNRVGLDHVVLVKVASTAVVSKLLYVLSMGGPSPLADRNADSTCTLSLFLPFPSGLSREQTIDAISQAWVDGQSLRTYRHAPNTGSRKSWAAGDACSRAVNLAYLVKRGEPGLPSVLTAKTWGFYDVLFKGRPFGFQRSYGSYVMENVLFKISYPAEFHAQTAVEAAMTLFRKMIAMGRSANDIASITIRTHEAAMRIIDKQGPLSNPADRDHCIQYMVAVPLIFGRLTAKDYEDDIASDPRIDALRAKITCVEDVQITRDYLDPDKRSIANGITVRFADGTILPEELVEYPLGHKRQRTEGIPLLVEKFRTNLGRRFARPQQQRILDISLDQTRLERTGVSDYVD